jgi:magnesium chelatase family protein
LRELPSPDAPGQKLLDAIIEDGRMTARGFNRVLRVARTLADLQARDISGDTDIATALTCRCVSLS